MADRPQAWSPADPQDHELLPQCEVLATGLARDRNADDRAPTMTRRAITAANLEHPGLDATLGGIVDHLRKFLETWGDEPFVGRGDDRDPRNIAFLVALGAHPLHPRKFSGFSTESGADGDEFTGWCGPGGGPRAARTVRMLLEAEAMIRGVFRFAVLGKRRMQQPSRICNTIEVVDADQDGPVHRQRERSFVNAPAHGAHAAA